MDKNLQGFTLIFTAFLILILFSTSVFGLISDHVKQTDSVIDLSNADLNSEEIFVNMKSESVRK